MSFVGRHFDFVPDAEPLDDRTMSYKQVRAFIAECDADHEVVVAEARARGFRLPFKLPKIPSLWD